MPLSQFQKEYDELNDQFGRCSVLKDVTLNFTNQKFFNEFKNKIKYDRVGEVAFFVERKNHKFIVIRTHFYPEGIYRIPTGGIQFGEGIMEALTREIGEELGLQTKINKFLGGVKYRINYKKDSLNYMSFVFWLEELGGTILEDATEDEISQFKEAERADIELICKNLKSNKSNWKDWCSFRYQTTSFILPFLPES